MSIFFPVKSPFILVITTIQQNGVRRLPGLDIALPRETLQKYRVGSIPSMYYIPGVVDSTETSCRMINYYRLHNGRRGERAFLKGWKDQIVTLIFAIIHPMTYRYTHVKINGRNSRHGGFKAGVLLLVSLCLHKKAEPKLAGGTPKPDGLIAEPLPDFLTALAPGLVKLGVFPYAFNHVSTYYSMLPLWSTSKMRVLQVLINEYEPRQGIMVELSAVSLSLSPPPLTRLPSKFFSLFFEYRLL